MVDENKSVKQNAWTSFDYHKSDQRQKQQKYKWNVVNQSKIKKYLFIYFIIDIYFYAQYF